MLFNKKQESHCYLWRHMKDEHWLLVDFNCGNHDLKFNFKFYCPGFCLNSSNLMNTYKRQKSFESFCFYLKNHQNVGMYD